MYKIFEKKSDEEYKRYVDKFFIRTIVPDGTNPGIKLGDVVKVIKFDYDESKNLHKYSVRRVSDGKRVGMTAHMIDKYYKEAIEKNVSDYLLKLIPSLKYADVDMNYMKEEQEEGNTISFLQLNRVDSVREKGQDPWKSPQRTAIRIGRFLKKALPYESETKIEELTNKIKSDLSLKTNIISEVKGEDIRFWYDQKNYTKKGGGTLHNSCMRHSNFGYKFDIYVDNPEKCSMIILLDDERRLLARAILWKTDTNVYLDRIYYTHDHERVSFEKYAKDHKWDYHSRDKSTRMTVSGLKMKSNNCDNYPYMDTFEYVYPDKGKIKNFNSGSGIQAHCH